MNILLKAVVVSLVCFLSSELKAQYTEINITNNTGTDLSFYLIDNSGPMIYAIVVPAMSSNCVCCLQGTGNAICVGDASSTPCGLFGSSCFVNGFTGVTTNTLSTPLGTISCSNPHVYTVVVDP